MDKAKDTAIFYRSFLNAIELIPNAEEKALAYKTLIKYALDETPPETASTIVNIIFMQAKPQIDINKNKYKKCIENGEKGAEFGKKGGRPKKVKTEEKQEQKEIEEKPQTKPQSKPLNDYVYVNVNDYVNERDTLSASLSQFKNFIVDIEKMDTTKYDIEKIKSALNESEFLQQSNMSFILNNYNKVITGKYKSFKVKPNERETTTKNLGYKQREYKTKELNEFYTNLGELNK